MPLRKPLEAIPLSGQIDARASRVPLDELIAHAKCQPAQFVPPHQRDLAVARDSDNYAGDRATAPR